jgi:hypothetical protein
MTDNQLINSHIKYPRRESNPNLMNRNHLFYSLNYEGRCDMHKNVGKTTNIFVILQNKLRLCYRSFTLNFQ